MAEEEQEEDEAGKMTKMKKDKKHKRVMNTRKEDITMQSPRITFHHSIFSDLPSRPKLLQKTLYKKNVLAQLIL